MNGEVQNGTLPLSNKAVLGLGGGSIISALLALILSYQSVQNKEVFNAEHKQELVHVLEKALQPISQEIRDIRQDLRDQNERQTTIEKQLSGLNEWRTFVDRRYSEAMDRWERRYGGKR